MPWEALSERVVDDLARAVHDHYLRARRAAGDDEATRPSMVAWERLPDRLREDNRDHARDVPRKLAAIGCAVTRRSDLAPAVLTDAEIERLARMEHARWMLAATGRRHPDLVPWEELTDEAREKDRSTLRTLPAVLAVAGLRIVRCSAAGQTGGDVGP